MATEGAQKSAEARASAGGPIRYSSDASSPAWRAGFGGILVGQGLLHLGEFFDPQNWWHYVAAPVLLAGGLWQWWIVRRESRAS